jgi:hypothetical protein
MTGVRRPGEITAARWPLTGGAKKAALTYPGGRRGQPSNMSGLQPAPGK